MSQPDRYIDDLTSFVGILKFGKVLPRNQESDLGNGGFTMDRPERYHPVHVTLHWLVALGVFSNIYHGIFVFRQQGMSGFLFGIPLQTLHMGVGIAILVFMLARLILRYTIQRPADATSGQKSFDILARVVHYGLYLSVLMVTVGGLVQSWQTQSFQTAFLGAQPDFNSTQAFPGGFSIPLHALHKLSAYLLVSLVGLHVLAALYHQFIRGDNLLARMWYGSR
jgi:cytochrome b561